MQVQVCIYDVKLFTYSRRNRTESEAEFKVVGSKTNPTESIPTSHSRSRVVVEARRRHTSPRFSVNPMRTKLGRRRCFAAVETPKNWYVVGCYRIPTETRSYSFRDALARPRMGPRAISAAESKPCVCDRVQCCMGLNICRPLESRMRSHSCRQ
mgnify:CR=1 FL=1